MNLHHTSHWEKTLLFYKPSTYEKMCFLPHAEDPCVALWCWDGKLDLVVLHGDLGLECTLMVHAGVHLNGGLDKFGDIYSHFGDKFNSDGGLEHQLVL